ncbi:MAG: hypothetical protein GY795_32735 [Desulfobacterales bacterium]|nr:hypothetical protein [Desulfobacterales bacterium]
MSDIILKTKNPDRAVRFLFEALQTETSRLKYSLELAKKRLIQFEDKYNVSSEKFMKEWSAEDLEGKDMEYIVWAGEFELSVKLQEHITTLEDIEYAA